MTEPCVVTPLGSYPTPVEIVPSLSRAGSYLWIKRDDQTNPLYGGNKVRKLERLLADARARGADRLVTVGAVGSHHVLATGIFGRAAGFRVEAIVVPQLRTRRVAETLRADLCQGIELFPAQSYAHAAVKLASRLGRGAYYIPPGGTNALGASGFVEAARELAAQVRAGEMPEPDLIVVALGTGGTAAGLAAGLAIERLHTHVLAVTVGEPAWYVERTARSLAKRCVPRAIRPDLVHRIEHDRRYLGAGYGHPTDQTKSAMVEGFKVGIELDETYTAKAFAAVVDRVGEGRERTILYWHTLSSAPMSHHLHDALDEASLDGRLRRLLKTRAEVGGSLKRPTP